MVIESTLFESFISLVILVNAGLVGVQLSLELQQQDGGIPFDTLEYTFLAIYIVELLMRCYAYGIKRQVIYRGAEPMDFTQHAFKIVVPFPRALADSWVTESACAHSYYSS